MAVRRAAVVRPLSAADRAALKGYRRASQSRAKTAGQRAAAGSRKGARTRA